MSKTITFGRRLVPVEQIALIEPFEPAANPNMKSERPFKARVVLLDRNSILTEEPPEALAEAHGFRALAEDGVFTNPAVHFSVEVFHPQGDFKPEKPYLSRLVWRAPDGNPKSKLLLATPEVALAIAVRGELPDQSDAQQSSQARAGTRRTRRRSSQPAPHTQG